MSSTKPTVVVVDDHALFRQGVIAAIGQLVEIVAEADDVQSGIDAIRRTNPEVVLLDVHLTSGSGAEVIEAIAQDQDVQTTFLALSVSDSPEDVLGLVRAGARGYVTKRIDGEDLVQAIIEVGEGNAVFSPRLAGFVLDAFTGDEPSQDSTTDADEGSVPAEVADDRDVERLTPREHEIMQYLARGYAYKEIAAELFISKRTVETHASSVLRKLQLSNRNELTHWAVRRRIV